MRQKLKFALCVVITFLAFHLCAQDSIKVRTRHIQNDITPIGFLHVSHAGLNDFLKTQGLPTVSSSKVSVGTSFVIAPRRLFLGFSIDGLCGILDRGIAGRPATTLTGFSSGGIVGYPVIRLPKWRINTMLQVNSNTYFLSSSKGNPVMSVTDVLSNPSKDVTLIYRFGSMDIGMSVMRTLPALRRRWDCTNKSQNSFLSLKAGYFFPLGNASVSHNSQKVTEAPALGWKGYYIKLSFVTSYRCVKQKSK